MIKNFVGFDAVEAAVDSFLGQSISRNYHAPDMIYRTCLLYAKPCTFDHIDGMEELKAEGTIKELFITKAKGDVIDGDMRSSNRVGSCVVEGRTMEELQQRLSRFYSHVKVVDINGNNMAIMPN